jgi:REP-associated tyrosine transposase
VANSPEYYRRHLPHWQPFGAIFFVTFRLKGSVPEQAIASLHERKEQRGRELVRAPGWMHAGRRYLDESHSFVKWDTFLDRIDCGPHWLARPDIAGILGEALLYRDGQEYELHAYCIMPNHVHAVLGPTRGESSREIRLNEILGKLKRHTARQANTVLGRKGPFWQDESYDHVIRESGEFINIVRYVLNNPVKAGFVSKWQDWPWTYCRDSAHYL